MIKLVIIQRDKLKEVFVYEDDELVERYEESFDSNRLEGNIFLGKVKNVIKGMQSAFVDIGTEKKALIHLKDVMPKESNIFGNEKVDINKYSITDYIKPGDEMGADKLLMALVAGNGAADDVAVAAFAVHIGHKIADGLLGAGGHHLFMHD